MHQTLLHFELHNEIPQDDDFDYFLCSLAKLLMPKGLLCYSEPRLLKQVPKAVQTKKSTYTLFRFVKHPILISFRNNS